MDRRNPQASTGCINWPDPATSGAQGGMSVWALILDEDAVPEACCAGLEVTAVITDSPTWDKTDTHSEPHRLWPNLGAIYAWTNASDTQLHAALTSRPLRAAVQLGTSGGDWYDERHGRPWQATYEDLTINGRLLIEALRDVHQADPIIVTILDT